jgi:hypothetical protein
VHNILSLRLSIYFFFFYGMCGFQFFIVCFILKVLIFSAIYCVYKQKGYNEGILLGTSYKMQNVKMNLFGN